MVVEGRAFSLRCPICFASVVANLNVTWHKDDSSQPSFSGLVWKITTAVKQNEGRYHCKVVYSGQTIVSNAARVTVEGETICYVTSETRTREGRVEIRDHGRGFTDHLPETVREHSCASPFY